MALAQINQRAYINKKNNVHEQEERNTKGETRKSDNKKNNSKGRIEQCEETVD